MSSKRIYRLQQQGDLLWLRVAVGRSSSNPLLLRLLVDTGWGAEVASALKLYSSTRSCFETIRL